MDPLRADIETDGVVPTLASAVADYTGKETTDLEPLYTVVDPDALERLFTPSQDGRTHSNRRRVEFTYAGCDVCVTNDEIIVQRVEKPIHGAPTD